MKKKLPYDERWDLEAWEEPEPHLASGKESSAIIITIAFFFILLLSFLWLAACGIMHLAICVGG